MAREPVTLGARSFANKTEAMAYVKNALNSYHPRPGEEIDLPPEGVAAMLDVFRRHPDFDRKFPHGLDGVERIFVKVDEAHGGRTNQFWYQYDGEKQDISFYKCFGRTSSYRRNCAVSAFREAIAPAKYACRAVYAINGDGVCALSGLRFPVQDLAVDHAVPFSLLLSRFIDECRPGLSLEDVDVVHISGSAGQGVRLADRSLARDWLLWHTRHARLQLVHKTLNMRLQDKDKDSPEAQAIIDAFRRERANA